jgi:hypothetical protein
MIFIQIVGKVLASLSRSALHSGEPFNQESTVRGLSNPFFNS